MVFEINFKESPKLDKVYEDAMVDLDSFFELGWVRNRPQLFIVPDRKNIDALMGKKTEDWVVGWSNGKNVYLLTAENYEQESSHKYSDKEYFALLKHELAHSFSNVVSNYSQYPAWLLEGISIFLSGQLESKVRPKNLEKFIGFYGHGKEVYAESGFAVEFLAKRHGKEKLLELLKGSGEVKSSEEFKVLFEKVYGFDLDYKNFEVL